MGFTTELAAASHKPCPPLVAYLMLSIHRDFGMVIALSSNRVLKDSEEDDLQSGWKVGVVQLELCKLNFLEHYLHPLVTDMAMKISILHR